MKKIIVVVWLLFLTVRTISPVYAEQQKVTVNYSANHSQIEVKGETLDAYHDEMARFYRESADLRNNIWEKVHLFANLLADPGTGKDEILSLQEEIQQLTNELQRQELSFRWDLNNLYPELAIDKYRGCLGAATGTRGPGR